MALEAAGENSFFDVTDNVDISTIGTTMQLYSSPIILTLKQQYQQGTLVVVKFNLKVQDAITTTVKFTMKNESSFAFSVSS